jgi:hypothetical protein
MKSLIESNGTVATGQDRYDKLGAMTDNEILGNEELPLPDEVIKARKEREIGKDLSDFTPKMELGTESFYFPSKNLLYGEDFDGHFNLRMFTTKEERIRLSSTAGFLETMVSILNNCISTSNGTVIDTKLLTEFDFIYLMYKARIVSYGPKYPITVRCPNCGKTFRYVADLDELETVYLDDDFKEPFTIGPLPKSGDILEMRFLRVYDRMEVDKEAREILAKNPDYQGDPAYNGNIERRIVTVNGKTMGDLEKKYYVENLSAFDNQYIMYKLGKVANAGINISINVECAECTEQFPVDLSVTSTFFRPEFDD